MHDFCLTASREPGIVTTGTRDWTDYRVTCTLAPGMHRRAGVVLRARGHRRFYAALLEGFDTLSIVQVENEKRTVLACAPFSYVENHGIPFSFSARGDMLEAVAGGVRLRAVANSRAGGGAGFFVEGGMLAASELCISAL